MTGIWPLAPSLAVLLVGGIIIALAGTRLVRLADQLADRTGLGEALFGVVFLGIITSLPGVTASVTAALDGFPELAFSNAVGGIAAQTLFLVVADGLYRGANLEHAATSVANMVSASLLIVLLGIALVAAFAPEVTGFGVHPASVALVVAYLVGLRAVRSARSEPQWRPRMSTATRPDVPEPERDEGRSTSRAFASLALLGAVVAVAGWGVARSGISIAESTGLSETFVGAVLTAVPTSFPELVTTLAAIRRGALVLAVGGIVGGNAFDVLFLAFADPAYQAGSIYHAVGPDQLLVLAMTLVMTAVLVLGLLSRQRRGFAGIGAEGLTIILLYLGTIALVAAD